MSIPSVTQTIHSYLVSELQDHHVTTDADVCGLWYFFIAVFFRYADTL